jgi:hypothetical protein
MALCTWCGQPPEPGAELCMTCGDTREASLVGSNPRALPRVLDSPGSSHGASSQLRYSAWAEVRDGTDPFWHREPDRSQFRLLQLGSADVVGQSAPTAADRDRQFRYDQAAYAADVLPPSDRYYAAKPASRLASPSPPALAARAGLASPSAPWTPAAPAPVTRASRARGDTGVGRRGPAAHGHRRLSPPPGRRADDTRNGRWVAMAAAGLLGVAAAAVVVVGHPGTADRASLARRQITDGVPAASVPSASLPSASVQSASVRSASLPQPTVDGLVTIEPDVAGAPHEAAVVAVMNRYFSAIDSHAYRVFKKLFSPAARGELSAAMFRVGYRTTRDSAATLRSIGVIGPRQVDAVVTFTSYQQARFISTQSSCEAWRISLRLIKSGHGYLLGTPPDGYQPSSRSCS